MKTIAIIIIGTILIIYAWTFPYGTFHKNKYKKEKKPIKRPYFIYKGRVCFKEPKYTKIWNDHIVYYFTMYDGNDLMLHEIDVYETEKEAKNHINKSGR